MHLSSYFTIWRGSTAELIVYFLQNQMAGEAGEVNPMIRQWMTAMTGQQLHRVLASVEITDDQVLMHTLNCCSIICSISHLLDSFLNNMLTHSLGQSTSQLAS
jgi:hypothetical protein